MIFKKEHQRLIHQVNKFKNQALGWQDSFVRQSLALKAKNEELEAYKMMAAENIEMYKNCMRDKQEVTHQLEKLQLELSMDAELDTTEYILEEFTSAELIEEILRRAEECIQ